MYIQPETSFRPLSGNYISKSQLQSQQLSNRASVSVPSRGTTFPNEIRVRMANCRACFRPLSGNYISKYHPLNPLQIPLSQQLLRGKQFFFENVVLGIIKICPKPLFKRCAANLVNHEFTLSHHILFSIVLRTL